MSLESNEFNTAKDFYIAFGNLCRASKQDPMLLARYENARAALIKRFQNNGYIATTAMFGAQELADLRHLLSIAVWIRSEQLAHPDAVHALEKGGRFVKDHVPSIEIDTHLLNIARANLDLGAARSWVQRLNTMLDTAGFKGPYCSWRDE